MYQTVGHSVIPLYEQALGIPLYRQEIIGNAVNSERDYSTPRSQQEQDETEDLVPLLKKAMLAHPEANAVSTGAILSTYQRTRVESVAIRLGLTPLSYLWQYPLLPPYSQSQLLHDMAAVGQEAIIIKTASGGLDERILGWNIAVQSTITKLQKAMARFGEESNGAVLGEGGEFETLALDGPKPLWKKKIRIEPGAAGVSEGGQSVLKMRASELEEKGEESDERSGALRIPDMFDDEFKRVLDEQENSNDTRSFISDDATLLSEPVAKTSSTFDDLSRNASTDTPTVFTYSNLSDTSRSSTPSSPSPSRQLTKILLRLNHVLKQWNLSRAGINHCTLLLRSMSDFTVLNPVYGQYFSGVNPPARVTISVGDSMPEGIDVMLSIVIDKDAKDRKGKVVRSVSRQGLHVQGRSYWAPANIGPYSQAISVRLPWEPSQSEASSGEVVYVAGQIPLIPASMAVYTERGFKGQATLSLQHLWRIGRAKGVRWWTGAVGFIPSGENPEEKVKIAQAAWRAIHSPSSKRPDGDEDEDEDNEDNALDIDPWDRRNTHTALFNDTTHRPPIPDLSALTTTHATPDPSQLPIPPCFVVQVESLPRDVDIEWSATGLTSPSISFSRSPLAPLSITHPTNGSSRFYTLEVRSAEGTDVLRHLGQESVQDWTSATLYAGPGFGYEDHAKFSLRGVQWVPCKRVWGEGGRECAAVLVGRCDGGGGDGGHGWLGERAEACGTRGEGCAGEELGARERRQGR
ncbi:meiotically up-regulated gene 71 protein [Macroventuria anomochaeta]|uniref:Meiotically up-regulated gene 71 protein n=1 Tax=Macroventuria anomochaeta TaxID=301207 RepID=A0ACB6RRK3_9PLEO|nr:meiotically up-regulated gene 71 protein [Macroventuria anomochaeta]KAF2624332.1 meiotically up-regulated gene 71 protein [Macroventuria anomochaeta]